MGHGTERIRSIGRWVCCFPLSCSRTDFSLAATSINRKRFSGHECANQSDLSVRGNLLFTDEHQFDPAVEQVELHRDECRQPERYKQFFGHGRQRAGCRGQSAILYSSITINNGRCRRLVVMRLGLHGNLVAQCDATSIPELTPMLQTNQRKEGRKGK